jgi:hypothetical protein
MPRLFKAYPVGDEKPHPDRHRLEIEPLSLLPCQFADHDFRATRLRPEAHLQLAVLEDALLTIHRSVGDHRRRARRLLGEVEAWLVSADCHGPFAFITICQALNLEPDYIRGGLRRWWTRMEITARRMPALRRDRGGCGICSPSGDARSPDARGRA